MHRSAQSPSVRSLGYGRSLIGGADRDLPKGT